MHSPPYANIMFCATSRSNDHFTGQIQCRLYPRSSPALDQARQLPLIKQKTTSPPRPSTVNFPAISQSVWTKNPLTNQPTAERNTIQSDDTDNNNHKTSRHKPDRILSRKTNTEVRKTGRCTLKSNEVHRHNDGDLHRFKNNHSTEPNDKIHDNNSTQRHHPITKTNSKNHR